MASSAAMAPLVPGEVFTLEIAPGETIPMVTAQSAFRITMAALDPNEPALPFEDNPDAPPRATLKIVRHPPLFSPEDWEDDDDDDDDDDDSDVDAIERRLGMDLDDEDDDSDEEDTKGGPSDPEKVKKARLEAAAKQLANGLAGEDEDMEEAQTNGVNGKVNKGKGKILLGEDMDDEEDEDEDDEDDEDDDDDDDDDDDEEDEFVVCTLDPAQHYQQPLDMTVMDLNTVSFRVVGTHGIYLTGNYIEDPYDDDDDEDDDDDDDYDDELDRLIAPFDEDDISDDSEEESDDLDDLENPRIKELDDEDDKEAPKLVKSGKGKNKRPAESDEEETEDLDQLISKTLKTDEAKTNGEQKLSKKQLKKLKKNDGQAAPGASTEAEEKKASKDSPAGVKKVQFAKNLEQGPTPSPKVEAKKEESSKPSGVKVVQGVTIDERKGGSGPAAKKGDRIGMRYIGKLEKDGKVFDSNKKGKPFAFKLGTGEVIKGWDIGVAGMKVGGERRITIPAHLAYGSKGMPGIPANSTLVFDVKLLSVN